MPGSGILDIENHVELAAIELIKAWPDITDLLDGGPAAVVQKRSASAKALWPSVYVEGYNLAEFGGKTGNYIGGLRVAAVTYKDDDKSRAVAKQIAGGLRAWIMQGALGDVVDDSLMTQLNNTASAQAAGTEIWFWAAEPDIDGTGGNAFYWFEPDPDPSKPANRINEGIQEITIVCMPSRP